jgi:sodium/pantothenate symporter
LSSSIIIFALYFTAIIALTYVTTKRMSADTTGSFDDEFYVAGRKMGPIALAILVAAGICSTGTFLGGPGVSGASGPGWYILLGGAAQLPMNLYILSVVGKKINIIGRRTGAQTYIDVFRYRYENYKPLIFVLVVTILTFLTAAAVAEFTGGSRVIEVMTGIPYIYSLLAFGAIITVYTALGGLKGVSNVAILQGIVMTLASIFLIAGYIAHFRGIGPIFSSLQQIDLNLLKPTGAFETPLIYLLGTWLTFGIGVLGLPWAVQATLGYGSIKNMKRAIFLGIIFVTFWTVFLGVFGGAAGRVFTPVQEVFDWNIPVLAQGVLPEYLSGLVLAGIAGAGQSTIAALFILASGSISVNAYKAFFNPKVEDKTFKNLIRYVTAFIGILTVILAIDPPASLQFIIIFSAGGSASSLISPLILGLFWPRANKFGAFSGVLGGLVAYIVFHQGYLGIPLLANAPFIFAFAISLILTIGVSLLTAKPSKETLQIYFGKTK